MREELDRIFGNIIVAMDSAWDAKNASSFLHRFELWLKRWHSWFLNSSGILEGQNLWRLYHRSVTISGCNPLELQGAFECLGKVTMSSGYTLACKMSFLLCATAIRAYQRFLENISLSNLIFKLENNQGDAALALCQERAEEVIKRATDKGGIVLLAGSPALWRSTGMFQLQSLNSKTFSLVRDKAVDRWREEKCDNVVVASSPCVRRMNLVILSSGAIYPCYGLVGREEWKLGTIDQEIEEMALNESGIQEEIASLINQGPKVNFNLKVNYGKGMHPACSAHLESLKLMSSDNK